MADKSLAIRLMCTAPSYSASPKYAVGRLAAVEAAAIK